MLTARTHLTTANNSTVKFITVKQYTLHGVH